MHNLSKLGRIMCRWSFYVSSGRWYVLVTIVYTICYMYEGYIGAWHLDIYIPRKKKIVWQFINLMIQSMPHTSFVRGRGTHTWCAFIYLRLWPAILYLSLLLQHMSQDMVNSWWRHQMEAFSALMALCAGTSSVTGEFPGQRPVTRSFDIFFDLHTRLSK